MKKDKKHTTVSRTTYPTLKSTAAALAVPLDALRQAKAAGCPAFRANGNVDVLALAGWLHGPRAWPIAVALGWMLVAVHIGRAVGETAVYPWWAIGAITMAAWGVAGARVERINLGAAVFGATIVTFFFSRVMDKLDRSASLIVLGIVLLGGGWAIERVRRRLVQQARSSATAGTSGGDA